MGPHRSLSYLTGLLCLCLCACSAGPQAGTAVGNGAEVQIDLRGYQGDGATPPTIAASGATVESVQIAVAKLRLVASGRCEGSTEDRSRIDIEGPLVADLLGDGLIVGSSTFLREPGTFCEVRLELHRVDLESDPSGTPAELDGLSIRVVGARADGTPFVVRSNTKAKLALKAKDGEFGLSLGFHPLFLAYDLDLWIEALDLDSLPGPSIVISGDSHETQLKAFESSVDESMRLVRDVQGDGSIDAEDLSDESALAD